MRARGFTLLELLISLALAGVVVAGALLTLSVNGDGAGNPIGGVPAAPPPLAGSPVSSIFAFDGHVLVNTINGGTTGGQLMVSAPNNPSGAWNTALGAGAGSNPTSLTTLFWQEL